MWYFRIISLLTLGSLFIVSCTESSSNHQISFYHWKTRFNLQQNEIDALKKMRVEKLYIRFFDIKLYEEKPKLEAILEYDSSLLNQERQIVPTIFITNNSLKWIQDDTTLQHLGQQIGRKLLEMMASFEGSSCFIEEIQLDCDWSMKTKQRYFRLIHLIKQQLPKEFKISVTIRLHQIKYPEKTGIPPVDKGVLMFYNMGDVRSWQEQNSILDLEIAKKYLERLAAYPLRLDIALPLFSWGVQFRDRQILQLFNELTEQDLQQTPQFFKKIEQGRYRVLKSTYLKGRYVYKNDLIKIESVKMKTLEAAMKLVKKNMKGQPFDLVFYHLDSFVFTKFDLNKLQHIAN